MTLRHPMTPFASLSTALIIGLAVAPRTADARQLPADRGRLVVAGDVLEQLDIDAILDQALRAASLAIASVDVARVVEQSLADARIEESIAMALEQADADRIQQEVDRSMADVDVEREISRALEEAREELRGDDIERMVREVLEDLDIDQIVREATGHARERTRRWRRQ